MGFGFWGASVDLLWIILEVLRFSQLIVLGRSVFTRQQQLLGGNNNLGTKKRKKTLNAKASAIRRKNGVVKVSFHLDTALNSAGYDSQLSTLVFI